MNDFAPFDYLSLFSSILICLIFSIVYILVLYVFSPSTQRYQRNHSDVIYRRIFAVLIICLFIYFFLKYLCNTNININIWLGFRTNISSIWTLFFYPILLILMLYTGQIVQWIILFYWNYDEFHWRDYFSHWNTNDKLIFIRNYLVAPFTEEFVFRSSILCLLYSHISLFSAIFMSPLFFGLAHFHHMLEHFHQNNSQELRYRISSMKILLIHLFQFSYTYIFGVYSSFLFIRTGHFIPSFIVHCLCNSFGLPDIISRRNLQIRYRKKQFIFLIFYFIGLWLFSMNLFYLTQSKFYYSNDNNMIIYRDWSSLL